MLFPSGDRSGALTASREPKAAASSARLWVWADAILAVPASRLAITTKRNFITYLTPLRPGHHAVPTAGCKLDLAHFAGAGIAPRNDQASPSRMDPAPSRVDRFSERS